MNHVVSADSSQGGPGKPSGGPEVDIWFVYPGLLARDTCLTALKAEPFACYLSIVMGPLRTRNSEVPAARHPSLNSGSENSAG